MRAQMHWLIVGVFVLAVAGCGDPQPIKIGFAGGLTGRVNDLGKEGRDGVMLAVEQTNASGGVDGRPIELIVKDDQQNADIARKVDQELIDDGVVAIIGHMTSSMSLAVLPLINQNKMVMISPTTSTNQLSGRDDYFLRTYPPSAQAAKLMARHMRDAMGLKTMTFVYDDANRAHSLDWFTVFRDEFERGDDAEKPTAITPLKFVSGTEFRASQVVRKIIEAEPDGLFILANALDTALICQQLRKLGVKLPIGVSQWSVSADLLLHGGQAVNGLIFLNTFDRDSTNPRFLAFKAAFDDRFGYTPAFAASHAYDAATVLIDALAVTTDRTKIKDTILQKKAFDGVQDHFVFDRFGDVHKKRFLATIRDGQFVAIKNQ